MTDQTVLAALIGGVVSVISAILLLRGRKEEVEGENLRALIQGQADRIDHLQTWQREQETWKRDMEKRLELERRRRSSLFEALESMVQPLEELEEWVRTGAKPPPPKIPRAARIRELLEANARNPPSKDN
ncbi:hypothetical protein [Corynebacterium ulceribovis]|uniref:hypothetical protein n=1 Tax=Corynebacterium ulceribovis TaxID=487732 RepID=UPI00036EDBF9|nr:hypothetical protein [Corynebacterium ulceribovis]